MRRWRRGKGSKGSGKKKKEMGGKEVTTYKNRPGHACIPTPNTM
jgi:hypothetical protein